MKIKRLTESVFREMETQEYAESTLQRLPNILKRIETWFNLNHDGEFGSEGTMEYLAEISGQLQSGRIGKKYYNALKLAANRLCEYAETGSIQFGNAVGRSKIFKPSVEHVDMIEKALAASNPTDKSKNKHLSPLRRFFCFVEAQGLCGGDITAAVMVSFINHCDGVSPGYMAIMVRSLRVLSEYLVSIGIMARKPDFGFIAPKRPPSKISEQNGS